MRLRRSYTDLIDTGSSQRQDILSKWRACRPWVKIEGGRGVTGRGAEKNVDLNKKSQECLLGSIRCHFVPYD